MDKGCTHEIVVAPKLSEGMKGPKRSDARGRGTILEVAMGKIRLNDLNKALRQCGIGLDYDEINDTPCFEVYHAHAWDHGYDGFYGIKVYEDGSYEDGRTAGFHGTRRQFYKDMRETIDFLLEYFRFKDIQELIIAPCYRYEQFSFDAERNDIYEEIYVFFAEKQYQKKRALRYKNTPQRRYCPAGDDCRRSFQGYFGTVFVCANSQDTHRSGSSFRVYVFYSTKSTGNGSCH